LDSSYHQPADAGPDLEGLDEIVKDAPQGENTNLTYFASRYFHQHGRTELARKYLQQCIETGYRIKMNYALGCVLARELPAAPQATPTDDK
jgi:hypothetical protein